MLDRFDQNLRLGLSRLANIHVNDLNWIQASLPVKDGGLGIRSVGLLAPPAFLASAAATQDLQAQLLPVGCPSDPYIDSVLEVWLGRYGRPAPLGPERSKQRCWDQASVEHGLEVLEAHYTDPYHRARLLATRSPHGGHWLHAWPISACGLRLDDEAVRVAVGLRIGVDLCEEHDCPCGTKVDRGGSHGLSCRRGAGRLPKHDAINDIIHRALIKAQIPSQKEPKGLTRDGTDKRVDGCTVHSVAVRQIHYLGCHHPRHSGTVTLAKDIVCQWRCCGRCLIPKNCKIHGSEAEIRFRSYRSRDPGPNERGWG